MQTLMQNLLELFGEENSEISNILKREDLLLQDKKIQIIQWLVANQKDYHPFFLKEGSLLNMYDLADRIKNSNNDATMATALRKVNNQRKPIYTDFLNALQTIYKKKNSPSLLIRVFKDKKGKVLEGKALEAELVKHITLCVDYIFNAGQFEIMSPEELAQAIEKGNFLDNEEVFGFLNQKFVRNRSTKEKSTMGTEITDNYIPPYFLLLTRLPWKHKDIIKTILSAELYGDKQEEISSNIKETPQNINAKEDEKGQKRKLAPTITNEKRVKTEPSQDNEERQNVDFSLEDWNQEQSSPSNELQDQFHYNLQILQNYFDAEFCLPPNSDTSPHSQNNFSDTIDLNHSTPKSGQ